MDKTMNRLQNAAVNNSLLEINDWQCSGDVDYLESAVAYLQAAIKLEGQNNE